MTSMIHIILMVVFSLPYTINSQIFPNHFTSFVKLDLPSTSSGPAAIAFDYFNRPYTGISDGRIVRYGGPIRGFVNFAYTSPNRSSELCDGINDPKRGLGPTCGRPLGLAFHRLTNKFFVVDAYYGLLSVGPQGGLATQLVNSAEGIPFISLNGLDVDQLTGGVYFTEGSTVYPLRELAAAVAASDSTGRLMKYDARTKQVTVLAKGLAGASGVSISADRSFVLVAEFIGRRIQKLQLRGLPGEAPTPQVLVNLPGMPHNIKRTLTGEFWVSLSIDGAPAATRIDRFGNVHETVHLDRFYNRTGISEFQQRGIEFFVGSSSADFLGVLSRII